MSRPSVTNLLERIVLAGVGLTSRALTEATTGPDLTFPQWRVLVVIGENAEGATLSEVAARVGVTLPATSRQLRRLERRGLVEIAPDPDDRRAARARLTSGGFAVRKAILAFRHARISEIARTLRLSEPTRSDLARIADALDPFR